jgi:hypothetical protein
MDYDTLGRLQSRQWFAVGSGTPGDTVTYHHDVLGRMDYYDDSRGRTSYSFDLDGRSVQIVSPEGAINYGYDLATRRHTRTWTSWSDLGYSYDELGRLQSVSVTKRDGTTLYSPEVTVYHYNEAGVVDEVTHPSGVTTENKFDALYRLLTVKHSTPTNNILAEYDYTRRADDRITRVVEKDNIGIVSTTDYVFDELGRLRRENYDGVAAGADYQTDYALDLVGNRLSKLSWSENGNIEHITSQYIPLPLSLASHWRITPSARRYWRSAWTSAEVRDHSQSATCRVARHNVPYDMMGDREAQINHHKMPTKASQVFMS